jgi:hypothetical protein
MRNASVGDEIATDVLMVDPATFADAVEWRPSYADAPVDVLMDRLESEERFTVNVLAAGHYADALPAEGVLSFGSDLAVRYRLVGRVDALPWQRPLGTMMVLSAAALTPSLPTEDGAIPGPVDTTGLDRIFRAYVLSQAPQAELERMLGPRLVLTETDPPNLPDAARIPEFVAYDHAMPYLRVVGLGMLVVAALGVVVMRGRRSTQLALEVNLSRRMGIGRRTAGTAHVGAAVIVSALAVVIGALLGVTVNAFMFSRLDPAPTFDPRFTAAVPFGVIAVSLVVIITATAAIAWRELRIAESSDMPEVLRAAE